jgi:uncharacterized protein YjdB
MKLINKLFFTIFIAALLHLPAAAKTCNFPYSEPLEGEVAVVGQAVDSERERFKVLNAFKGKEVSVGGGLATLSASLVRHYDEIYEKTYLKRGGKFGIGPFKFSKSREFTTTVTKKNYTATFMLMFEVNLPNGKWQIDTSGGTPLTDYAQTLVNKPCEFKRIFGDSFIFQTQRGARVYVAINVSFSSDERLKDFNRGMDASLEGKFNGFTKKFCGSCGIEKIFKIPAFDFSASFDSTKSNISTSTLRDGKIEIIAMQIGGDASRLGQIFGSGGDVTLASCSLDALSNCDAAFKNVLMYLAQEEFAEGVKAHPEVISYLHRGYWEVDPSIQLVNEVTPEIETARNQLAEHLLERELDLKTAKNTLALSLINERRQQQLKDLEIELEQEVTNIKTAGFTCFSYLENCSHKTTQVLSNLQAYDRSIVQPNRLTDYQPYLQYKTHIENIGWTHWSADNEVSGTTANSLRMEAIIIKSQDMPIDCNIMYRSHVANIGWLSWVSTGELSGTVGQSKRLEGLEVSLVNLCPEWSIHYRSHVQNIGWQNWVKNGEISGTTGQSLRMEAIQIKIEREIPLNSINQNPFASFSTSAVEGAPLTINLNATDSSDADGRISRYDWLSSTGQTANGKTASLSFSNPGEYNITLTVTDDKGATSQAVKNINLQASRIITNPCNNTTITDCRANYLSNGKLCAPCVIVPGALGSSQIFAVEMNTQPFSQTFKVDLPTLRQHNFQDSCAANYSPISGNLKFPCVFDGTKNYAMEMQQRRGSLIFDITGVR